MDCGLNTEDCEEDCSKGKDMTGRIVDRIEVMTGGEDCGKGKHD